jgi:hypothetical protein
VIRFDCDGCGTALAVPEQLAGARGECPVCRHWMEAPRPIKRRSRVIASAPAGRPFQAQWVIEPDRTILRAGKLVDEARRTRRVGRRRSRRLIRRAERSWEWVRRCRGLLSLGAIVLLATTYFYLKHVNWQPPWQLPESSVMVKWLGDGQRRTSGGGNGPIPDKPGGF